MQQGPSQGPTPLYGDANPSLDFSSSAPRANIPLQGSVNDGRTYYPASSSPHPSGPSYPSIPQAGFPTNPPPSPHNPTAAYPFTVIPGTYGSHNASTPATNHSHRLAQPSHPFSSMTAPTNPSTPPVAISARRPEVGTPIPALHQFTTATPLHTLDITQASHHSPQLVRLPESVRAASTHIADPYGAIGVVLDSLTSHEQLLELLLRDRLALRASLTEQTALRAQIDTQVEALNKLQITVDDLSESIDSAGTHKKKNGGAKANDYPMTKERTHEMYWKMLDLPGGDIGGLVDLVDAIKTAAEGGTSVATPELMPDYDATVKKAINRKFCQELAQRVYDNEKVERQTKPGKIEDTAFNNFSIISDIAKAYHQYVQGQWKLESTPEGRVKRQANILRAKEYRRRATKLLKRLVAALWASKYKGMEGIETMLCEEYMSSAPDYISGNGSPDSTKRRTEQGSGRKGTGTRHRFWRNKKFITLIWYLDRIAETEDLSEFKQTEANREGDPQEPVTKRQKTSRGRARQPQAIKNFYLAWKHANDRPPNVPPPDGTVRKTWLERYLEKTGDQLETKPAPQFWAEWKPDVSLLSAAQQELLRDVPSEDEDAEIEQEEQNAM